MLKDNLTIAFYTKDRHKAVGKALKSALGTTPKGVKFLIVEDQPKTPFRLSKEYKETLFTEDLFISEIPRKSSCGQLMNRCIIDSDTQWVLFCNDDLVFKEGWFEIAEKYYDKFPITLMFNFGACLINKSIIPKLGYFDERFLGGNREDQDMMIRILLKDIPHVNTWDETGESLITHEPFYYQSACWNGEQNEKYFIEKWGSIDYGALCKAAKEKSIKPNFIDGDWYPSYTTKYIREYA
tara:strand:- start:1057 stop:1773 length:717 start_codon:yes stop_codon:yes gene_type:complete